MRAINEVRGQHSCLKRSFTGSWFRLVKRRARVGYPAENIAPMVGALNSTEDQATRDSAGNTRSRCDSLRFVVAEPGLNLLAQIHVDPSSFQGTRP